MLVKGFIERYNHRRRHQGINRVKPCDLYQKVAGTKLGITIWWSKDWGVLHGNIQLSNSVNKINTASVPIGMAQTVKLYVSVQYGKQSGEAGGGLGTVFGEYTYYDSHHYLGAGLDVGKSYDLSNVPNISVSFGLTNGDPGGFGFVGLDHGYNFDGENQKMGVVFSTTPSWGTGYVSGSARID